MARTTETPKGKQRRRPQKQQSELEARVRARLKEIRKRPTDLGVALGYDKSRLEAYQGFYKVFVNERKALTPDLAEKAAKFLRWPVEELYAPNVADLRKAEYENAVRDFLREGGNQVNPDIVRTIETMQFFGEHVPTADGLKQLALFLEGLLGSRPMSTVVATLRLGVELESVPEPVRTPRRPR